MCEIVRCEGHYLDNFEHLDVLDVAAAPGARLVLVAQLLEALLLALLHLYHLQLHQAAPRPRHQRHVKVLVLGLDEQHLVVALGGESR